MKRLLYFSAIVIALASCKGKQSEQAATAAKADSTKVNTTEYTCPMHPEVNQNEPGKCPRCGMDLEAKS